MDFSLPRILIIFGVTAAVRLATLYLRRLDGREKEAPEARRWAIAASRRRAQGHMWLLGALISLLIVFVLLAGVNRPTFGPLIVLLALGLVGAAALCVGRMVNAYRDARRIRAVKRELDPQMLLRDDFLERTFGELLESGGLDDQD